MPEPPDTKVGPLSKIEHFTQLNLATKRVFTLDVSNSSVESPNTMLAI
jgi:hypothetical protein